jgi:hypothetical protein
VPNVWKGIEAVPVLIDAGINEEHGLVRIPYRLRDGTEHNAKLFPLKPRTRGPRSWWERTGRELVAFGLETLPDPEEASDALLIAEGESDALALRYAFAGVTGDNPVRDYHVLGLPGAGTWREEWSLLCEPFPFVYVLGDGDARGQALNDTIKRDVPWARAVKLPLGEDARSMLQHFGWRALDPYLEEADADARLAAAFRLAADLPTFEALLRGQEVLSRAA